MAELVQTLKRIIQFPLDAFSRTRRAVAWLLAYLSLRVCGLEVRAKDVWRGKYSSTQHQNLNLDNAGDLPLLLDTARVCLANAQDRRSVVSDKCKTLLTVSSILLTLIGLLLPKFIHLQQTWMGVSFFIAMGALLNTIILLLVFFDVGADMEIDVGPDDVARDTKDMQKNLINSHLQCQTALDNRTDYLVDLYKAARFFFLSAFSLVILLFATSFFARSSVGVTEDVIVRLRSDTAMIELLRGPMGDKGEKGDKGDEGDRGVKGEKGDRGFQPPFDFDALVSRVLNDPRFRDKPKVQPSSPDRNQPG